MLASPCDGTAGEARARPAGRGIRVHHADAGDAPAHPGARRSGPDIARRLRVEQTVSSPALAGNAARAPGGGRCARTRGPLAATPGALLLPQAASALALRLTVHFIELCIMR